MSAATAMVMSPPRARRADPPSASPRAEELLELIHAYRLAARSLVRQKVPEAARRVAIVKLLDAAREEPACATWCVEAVRREALDFVLTGRVPEPPTIDPMVRELRALKRRGLARCEACLRPVPSDLILDQLEEGHLVLLKAWAAYEGAVRSGRATS